MDKVFGRFQRYFSGSGNGHGSNSMVTSSSSSNDDREGSDIEDDFDDFSTERSRFGFGLLERSYAPISTKDSRNQHGLDHKTGFFSQSPSNIDQQKKYYPSPSKLDSGNTSSSYHTQSPSEGGGLGGSFQGFSDNDGRKGSEDWASDWQDNSWQDDGEASKSRKPAKSSSVKKANPDPLIDFGSEPPRAKKASQTSTKKSNDNWGDNWGDDDAWESLNEK
ncbi:hypothetical protein TCAL_14950 [Tigriopus californicus]|uniref:Uncharacterized protein n=1 Tax=Tigriopus californicus TaxID=6832 RepID=A0A553N8V9_TIGCA|nr:hypothetical protein TCAL_14950 [Tigriopus californicus]